jgi:hypothetical protein
VKAHSKNSVQRQRQRLELGSCKSREPGTAGSLEKSRMDSFYRFHREHSPVIGFLASRAVRQCISVANACGALLQQS